VCAKAALLFIIIICLCARVRLRLDQSWLAELALIWLSEIPICRLDLHAKSLNFLRSKQNCGAQKYTSLAFELPPLMLNKEPP
jgi:hypothetical protein